VDCFDCFLDSGKITFDHWLQFTKKKNLAGVTQLFVETQEAQETQLIKQSDFLVQKKNFKYSCLPLYFSKTLKTYFWQLHLFHDWKGILLFFWRSNSNT
jgi:trehalose/maltose hydrolase-like predicted phosphorylase